MSVPTTARAGDHAALSRYLAARHAEAVAVRLVLDEMRDAPSSALGTLAERLADTYRAAAERAGIPQAADLARERASAVLLYVQAGRICA